MQTAMLAGRPVPTATPQTYVHAAQLAAVLAERDELERLLAAAEQRIAELLAGQLALKF